MIMRNFLKALAHMLAFMVLTLAWATHSMKDLRKRVADIQKLKCNDLKGWQEQLDHFARAPAPPHLLLTPAEKCMPNWSSSVRACFDNMKRFAKGREAFAKAGETQDKHFGDRFNEMTDLSDIFECHSDSINPAISEKGKVKISKPFAIGPMFTLNAFVIPIETNPIPIARR